MPGTKLFHIGIVVEDIEQAIEDFGDLLGFTFEAPISHRATGVEVYGEKCDFDIRFVYSNEGPPYIELIEAKDERVRALFNSKGEGLHHLGAWQEDVADRVEELLAQGHKLDFAARFGPDQGVAVCYFDTEHPKVHGTRIEFLPPGPVIRGFDADGNAIGE